jgi:hypothetical protein
MNQQLFEQTTQGLESHPKPTEQPSLFSISDTHG